MCTNREKRLVAIFRDRQAALITDIKRLKVPDHGAGLGAACILCRIVTNLRAIEILYKSRLAIEADTILRSCLEAVFWLGAISNDPDFVDLIESDDNRRRRTLAKHILEMPRTLSGLEVPDIAALQAKWDDRDPEGGLDAVQVIAAAKAAGMASHYALYLSLSNNAAHTSGASMNRHFKEGKAITTFVEDADWADTYSLACELVFFAKHFIDKIFPDQSPDWHPDTIRDFISAVRDPDDYS